MARAPRFRVRHDRERNSVSRQSRPISRGTIKPNCGLSHCPLIGSQVVGSQVRVRLIGGLGYQYKMCLYFCYVVLDKQ